MKILIVLLLLLIVPFFSQSKSKYSRNRKAEFLKFAIGPEIGGMGYFGKIGFVSPGKFGMNY